MAPDENARRLIVNADDFGCSAATNQAVIRAHQEGILTSASLMVNGDSFSEAIDLAHQNPRLGIGLHLTLASGRAALDHAAIPGLVNKGRNFSNCPVKAGFRYFACKNLRDQLRREIVAQFDKFNRAGLKLDHLNGHLNMHLHPVVFGLLMQHAEGWGIRSFRLTCDPLRLSMKLARGRWLYRISHAIIFGLLARRARPALQKRCIQYAGAVFGLLQNGRVTERYVLDLLQHLPAGNSELYSHPSVDNADGEFDALVSPRVKEFVDRLNIKLVRYQDLLK